MGIMHRFRKFTSFQVIIFGFAIVILVGALLLCLPISSQSGKATPFSDALFTSTSAVCVTGLVVHDTATYWSYFGQAVILVLIQIGGMGVITVAAAITMIAGRKIGLMQRSTMQEAISAPAVGGIVRLTNFVIKGTFLIELLGAVVMAPVFIRDFGLKGIWMAVFHSISAFCNAGFDLLGSRGEFSSLTSYVTQPAINVTIMLLIMIGGIGFFTWDDVYHKKWRIKSYRLQSKVILVATASLILLPTVYFFFFEFEDFPMAERIWMSFFQAVTPRTAGFNTADLTKISEVGVMLIIFLMVTGGAPGSTAGGMKNTTLAVLLSSAVSVCKKRDSTKIGSRRIADDTVKLAATIMLMYVTLVLVSGGVISMVEGLPLQSCLFETASAIGTVGLTLGITTSLGTVSRVILILLMFFGRVGGLTLVYAALGRGQKNMSKLPLEKMNVG